MPDDGPRWIEVSPERFPGWIAGFAGRHGPLAVEPGPEVVTFRAADGATAACHPPFPPCRPGGSPPQASPAPLGGARREAAIGGAGGSPPQASPAPLGGARREAAIGGAGGSPPQASTARGVAEWSRGIARHAAADRTVGVLLVRLGGYAAGVFTGVPPRLAASKVGSRLVHGRSAAGGQSQQRFARRREKQAAEALAAAADTAHRVFGGYPAPLDAVVLGGDRRAMAGLRGDPRLAEYFALAVDRFLTVPDPRLAVLRDTPRLFRAVRVQLTGPPGDRPPDNR